MTTTTPCVRWRLSLLSGALLLLAPTLIAQVTPPTLAAGKDSDVVDLNPFVVSADSVNGYTASQTLAGTRLRTDARDIGSAMTILTPDFLDDIGATDITSAFDFVPSTETYRLSASDTDGNSSRSGSTSTTRGFTTSSLSLNFFTTNVRIDRYNTESFNFDRGPNSILFGAGSPGGLIDSETKQANLRGNSTKVELRYNSAGPGAERGTIDQNLSFKKQRFAVRVDVLYQKGSTPQTPSRDDRRSLYLTMTKELWAHTTIRFNAERGDSDREPGRQYVVFDHYTPWVNAGRPLISGTKAPTGTTGVTATGANYLVQVEGSNLPVMNWAGLFRGANPTINGTAHTDISFTNESIIPYLTNVGGPKDMVHYDWQNYSAFIEQRVGESLAFELAAQYEPTRRNELISVRGADYSILADAAATLPNGAPNPYAGMPFIENSNAPLANAQRFNNRQTRLTTSYELDLRDKGSKWFNLGKYQFAGLAGTSWEEMTLETFNELNTVGNPVLSNAANRIHHRTYLLPGNRNYYDANYSSVNQAAGNPATIIPAVVSKWGDITAARHTYTTLNSLMFSGQAHYLNDHLVLTFGIRKDKSDIRGENYTAAADGTFTPWEKGGFWVPAVYATGRTSTLGGVIHFTENLSAYYNTSDNFSPPSANTIDVWGNIVPPMQGHGSDAGVKFSFFGGKLLGSVGYFETTQLNATNSTLRSDGNKSQVINDLWAAVDPSKETLRTDWSGVYDIASHGAEMQFVYTPTPNWRIMLNGSRNITMTSNLMPEIISYVATYRPVWTAKANAPAVSSFGTTVGQVLASLDQAMAQSLAQEGQQSLGQRTWAANFVTNYKFSRTSLLKGFDTGATAQWRSSPTIGYRLNSAGQLDGSNPFYGKNDTVIGAWVGYRLKWRDRDFDFRLRGDNLFGKQNPYLYRAVDGGAGNPVQTVTLKPTPQTFTFSTSVAF